MAYTVLARRYRSATFDEVVGQSHVAQTLKRAIESGRIAHAYLFCGTRGVGKTSMARILAKSLNCEKASGPTPEPCGKCASCLAIARGEDIDVIEIDAASNTGVDNIREVIENSQYRPARCRFKVYIIDEVHMLSKSAFNALLKTLEEPPGHVKFILATTEPEKVLPTILSRCQRYDFRNIPTREIAGHLKEICKSEKIEADEDALLLVAKAGAGSMRDALSLLDRLLSIGEKRLTADLIEQLLGMPKSQLIFALAQSIGQGQVKETLTSAQQMIQGGLSPDTLIASLVDHLRNLLILRTCGVESNLIEVPGLALDDLDKQAQQFDVVALTQDITILEELRRQMRQSQAGRALLDAVLVRLALAEQFSSVADLLSRVNGGSTGMPAQKKKPEPASVMPTPVAGSLKTAPVGGVAPVGRVADPALPSVDGVVDPVAASATPPIVGVASDDDDDLPRPGKVWDSSGPSLSELLKQTAARIEPQPSTIPPPAASEPSNVEAVDPANLPAVWKSLLELAAETGPGLPALLIPGTLVAVDGNQAVIRYGSDHDTFPKMLERNGKKEQLRDAFSRVLNRSIGVRFEVDSAPAAAPSPAPAEAAKASRPNQRPARPPEPVMQAPAAATIPLTPELRKSMETDPLVKAVIDTLGGMIVKVE